MDFHIADTFTESVARLTEGEWKAAKATAFDPHARACGDLLVIPAAHEHFH